MVWTLTLAAPLAAQMPPGVERQRAARERQQSALAARQESAQSRSLERQRESVEKQKEQMVERAPGFFALPWPEPPRLSSLMRSVVPDCERLPEGQIEAIVEQSARESALEPALLRAVMRRESGFYPCAVSRAGAMGLMQLMPATAAGLGVANPFDPQENARAGSRFLRQMLERYGGNLALALGAYNAGPAQVDRSGSVPPLRETQDYVRHILTELNTPLWGGGP
ncbi:MAG: lytic transglycosylase domain-containing protein [Bryobacteraceae bacterium]|nr:lytic transglycosylase domain-containing protein [Bryobacteraceae bacterium]